MLLAALLSLPAQADEYSPDPVMEQMLVFEDKAIARFETCLELAETHDQWSSWQDDCLTSLSYLQPSLYPKPKPEARGSLEVTRVEPALIPRSGPARP